MRIHDMHVTLAEASWPRLHWWWLRTRRSAFHPDILYPTRTMTGEDFKLGLIAPAPHANHASYMLSYKIA